MAYRSQSFRGAALGDMVVISASEKDVYGAIIKRYSFAVVLQLYE